MNHHCNMQVALKDNQIVKIQDIERGKNCNCICPACGSPLIARKGNVNIWHFSHINGSNCTYGYQTSLHLLAKDIFTKIKKIKLPPVDSIVGPITSWREVDIQEVYLEKSEGDFIPDIIIVVNGIKIAIEIYVTHKVDEVKQAKLEIANLSTIEIDLSSFDRDITEQDLIEAICNETPCKYWIYNKKAKEINQSILDKIKLKHPFSSDAVECPLSKCLSKRGNYFASIQNDCKYCKFNINHFSKYYNNLAKNIMHIEWCLEELIDKKLLEEYKKIKLKFPTSDQSSFEIPVTHYDTSVCLGEALINCVDDLYLDKAILKDKYKYDSNLYQKRLLQGFCPSCGSNLSEKVNRNTGEIFYGCSSWHETGCRFSINYDAYWDKIKQYDDIWNVSHKNILK